MERKLILTAVISGSLGFLLAAVFLRVNPSRLTTTETQTAQSKLTVANAPAKPTSLLRRHERQSREAVSEAEAIIAEVLRRKEARLTAVRDHSRGFLTFEDQQEMMAIEKEAELELRNSLSPVAYYTYQGQLYKDTEVGRKLVRNLSASDAELAAIAEYKRIQASFDPKIDNSEQRRQNQAKLTAKVGEERAEELRYFHDSDYSEAYAFAQRFELDPSVALQIIQLKKESLMKRAKINQTLVNGPYVPGEADQKSSQVLEQARNRLAELVGPEAAKIYLRDAEHGEWLR